MVEGHRCFGALLSAVGNYFRRWEAEAAVASVAAAGAVAEFAAVGSSEVKPIVTVAEAGVRAGAAPKCRDAAAIAAALKVRAARRALACVPDP